MTSSKVSGGGLMLPISLISTIDKHRSYTNHSRSSVLWDLVSQGIKAVDPFVEGLIQRSDHSFLSGIARDAAPAFDYADTRPGVLKGFSVAQGPNDRALVLGLDLSNLGDNPSYAIRVRYLIGLGLDRLLIAV